MQQAFIKALSSQSLFSSGRRFLVLKGLLSFIEQATTVYQEFRGLPGGVLCQLWKLKGNLRRFLPKRLGGALFRVILFGFDPTFIGKRRDAASIRPGSLAIGKPDVVIASLVLGASGLMLYYVADHRVSMTKRMYCECQKIEDKADPFRPHLEELRLVYQDNPRFEERLAGPSLCADLRRAGQQTAGVTFDVWHNWKSGRGGYIIKKIVIGGKRREIFGTMIGGFHPDSKTYVEYTDSAPDPARFADFPLNQH